MYRQLIEVKKYRALRDEVDCFGCSRQLFAASYGARNDTDMYKYAVVNRVDKNGNTNKAIQAGLSFKHKAALGTDDELRQSLEDEYQSCRNITDGDDCDEQSYFIMVDINAFAQQLRTQSPTFECVDAANSLDRANVLRCVHDLHNKATCIEEAQRLKLDGPHGDGTVEFCTLKAPAPSSSNGRRLLLPSQCTDGTQFPVAPFPDTNYDLSNPEADTDCGGPCAPCVEDQKCCEPTDCQSNVCDVSGLTAPCDTFTTNPSLSGKCGGPTKQPTRSPTVDSAGIFGQLDHDESTIVVHTRPVMHAAPTTEVARPPPRAKESTLTSYILLACLVLFAAAIRLGKYVADAATHTGKNLLQASARGAVQRTIIRRTPQEEYVRVDIGSAGEFAAMHMSPAPLRVPTSILRQHTVSRAQKNR